MKARLLFSLMFAAACSDGGNAPLAPEFDGGMDDRDAGNPMPGPDAGNPPQPDAGQPGPDAGPPPPPPPQEVTVSGRVIGMADYLAGVITPVQGASVLTFGVTPPDSQVSDAAGAYELTAPANGQVILFANRTGYFQSYLEVTTGSVNLVQDVAIAESSWVSSIAQTHNVNIATPFACAPPRDPTEQCIYGIVVGRILDDGTLAGTPRPVDGVLPDDFTVLTGPNDDAAAVRGPYFLDPDGTPNAANAASQVSVDGIDGGLFVIFVEVPQLNGPVSQSVALSVQSGGGIFGEVRTQVFRPYGVTWVELRERGVLPPPNPNGVDFDSQIYPLFLTVDAGGLGCQGCHTNQGGAVPAAGMNLYGGPAAAYASLDPNVYPNRVNLDSPDDSLLLRRPLYEAVGPQDHPIFAFASPQDLAYRTIRQWIVEGATRNAPPVPVSFYNEVRPLLSAPTGEGGIGCAACHVAGVGPANAPAGLYMGGTAGELLQMLTRETPADNGATGEAYRVNTTNPERSLLLLNPLDGSLEPHPVKIFASAADPRYQLLSRWITEGALDVREAPQAFAAGEVTTTPDGVNLGYSLEGSAFLIRDPVLAETNVGLFVLGLNADTTYAAHVHDAPCATGGGAHYKIDPTVQEVIEANEIWPTVTTSSAARGWGTVRVPHVARAEAQSIVIHEPNAAGTRIGCIDLTPDAQLTAEAQFAPLPDGVDFNVSGSAFLTRSSGGTEVQIRLQGNFQPDTTYPAHVHDAPCAENAGGGHYKIDVDVAGALPENEIWPALEVGVGYGAGEAYSPHVARYDAWSVVVHDPNNNGARIACASFELGRVDGNPLRFTYDTTTSGEFRLLPDGVARNVPLTGSAALVRNAEGDTSAMVWVANATVAATYPAHVHDAPCAAGGGGHYLIDPAINEVIEANEIWPTVTTTVSGYGFGGTTRLGHFARIDAQSVVIHDPNDGARLLCADLGPSGYVVARGDFALLPDGAGLDLTGYAEVRRISGRGTYASISVSGTLQADTAYPAHVHNAACADGAGGGHYQAVTGGPVDPYNEIWPTMYTNADGSAGVGSAYNRHVGRYDARSVVIHDPATGARLACADLRPSGS